MREQGAFSKCRIFENQIKERSGIMKRWTKMLAFALAISLVCTALPATAFAKEAEAAGSEAERGAAGKQEAAESKAAEDATEKQGAAQEVWTYVNTLDKKSRKIMLLF